MKNIRSLEDDFIYSLNYLPTLKGLEDLVVGGRVETIQTTTLLRTARILRRVLET